MNDDELKKHLEDLGIARSIRELLRMQADAELMRSEASAPDHGGHVDWDKIEERRKASKAYIPGYCPPVVLCRDLDPGCEEVRDKCACAAYDPEKGVCPYVIGHPEFT